MVEPTELRAEIPVRRPMTPLQRSLLAFQLREPQSPALNMALLARFDSPVDADRLARSFDDVVTASDCLRSVIRPDDLSRVDVLPNRPGESEMETIAEEQIDEWVERAIAIPIDLEKAGYRSTIFVDDGQAIGWLIEVHHLLTDATASTVIVEDTLARYGGASIDRHDFYSISGDAADEPTADRRVASTSRKHTGPAARYTLFAERASPLGELWEGPLRLLTRDLTLTSMLATVAAIELGRTAADRTVRIGVPVHHRSEPKRRRLIGPVMNMTSIEIVVDPSEPIKDLHGRVTRELFDALRVNRPTGIPDTDHDAVVNVIPRARPNEAESISFRTTWLSNGAIDPQHQLRLQATSYEAMGELEILVDLPLEPAEGYAPDITPAALERAIEAVIGDPTRSVCHVPSLAESEVDALRCDEQGPATDRAVSIPQRLRASLVDRDGPALIAEDETITGRELWRWISTTARWIDESQPPDARIAVELPRSTQAVVAILAIVCAGRSFVPLDPRQPLRRRDDLATRAGVGLRIAQPSVIDDHRSEAGDWQELEPSGEAYVLFTSGSTGEPKGVPIRHDALASYLDFATSSYFDVDIAPVAPLFTPLTFDLTITTLFGPLLAGGALHVVGEDGGAGLTRVAAITGLTWMKATPSHLEILTRLDTGLESLRAVVVGGEAFSASLAERLAEHAPHARLFNEYGPTEAVVGCMIHEVEPGDSRRDSVPIGRPAPGVELRIVDQYGCRSRNEVPGELLISHSGLTDGYLSGDDARFVELDGSRFYRSGDRVVRHHDGVLTYLGRVDEEVKVGGIRLSPVEVERALERHPGVTRAAVRLWSPAQRRPEAHCVRCGLPDNVPGVVLDHDGVCDRCHDFERIKAATDAWFGTEQELARLRDDCRARRAGPYDCIFMLSGGKDSTWGLYKLVELGFEPLTVTYDNGFISDGAKRNIDRVTNHLQVDHRYLTTMSTRAILQDSLATFSDVCHGCYKALYTLATNTAVEVGAPALVSGLSRGQLFETRLAPGQFESERFDPEAIDAAVLSARKRYHRAPDLPNRLLETDIFADDDVFERVQFVDLYRYIDVELADVLDFLEHRTPWVRPADTGRSSNCLVNVAGIRAHQIERGYHNYAEPYAWDVRLGHKTREAALTELDDPIDETEIRDLFEQLGYQPQPAKVLTAWIETPPGGREPTAAELRRHLDELLPTWAIPAAFVTVDELPLNTNGKVAIDDLPAPHRRTRPVGAAVLEPETATERLILEHWQRLFDLEPLSVDDDFFALGGDSLAAISMMLGLSQAMGAALPEELAFVYTTTRELAAAIDAEAFAPLGTDVARAPEPDGDETPRLDRHEQALLYEQRLRPNATMYNVTRMFLVHQPVDRQRFAEAVHDVVAMHPALTWNYAANRERLPLDRALSYDEDVLVPDHDELERHIRRFRSMRFDVEAGPLARCELVRVASDDSTAVLLGMHHVCADHQSISVLWNQIAARYEGRAVEPPGISLRRLRALQAAEAERCAQHWIGATDEWSAGPSIPLTGDAAPDFVVSKPASVTDDEFDRTAGSSPVAKVVAAAVIASRSLFLDPVVQVALVASTRTHPESEELIGYLLNPVPVQVDLARAPSPSAVISETATWLGAALPHRSYPFASIVDDARRAGRAGPRASVLVSYIDDPPAYLDGRRVVDRSIGPADAVADISFFVERLDDRIELMLECRGEVIDRAVATALLDEFDTALDRVVRADTTPFADVVPPRPSVLAGPPLDDERLVLERIRDMVALDPDRIAVIGNDRSLTRRQLEARAGRIAHTLKARGVGPGDRVAVMLPRSPDLPAAMLGVMMARAVYVPIDASYPDARKSLLIESAAPGMIISDVEIVGSTPNLVLDEMFLDDDRFDDITPPRDAPHPEDVAYVIYTSGSTGRPNGVPISHRQLARSTNARDQVYESAPTRFAMVSSPSFDSSIVGLFWPLVNGGAIVLPDQPTVADPDALAAFLVTHEPSHVLMVPTLYALMLERSDHSTALASHLIVAGEACPERLVVEHRRHFPTVALTNEYGPTEATVWATSAQLGDRVTIGSPIPGLSTAVVDATGSVVTEGLPGELWLAGDQVSAGYLGEIDHARFQRATATSPFPAGTRIFRTGDRVVQKGGALDFLGRIDEQLSIGGVRIEPTEIEGALLSVEGVHRAAVVAVDSRSLDELMARAAPDTVRHALVQAASADDPAGRLRSLLTGTGQSLRLVAHVETSLTIDDLHAAARDLLPAGRRPTGFVLHEGLPRLPNGKIDRGRLRSMAPSAPSHTHLPGGAPVDELCTLFAEVIGLDDVDPSASFFELGGDSLLAFELIRRAESRFGRKLPLRLLHDAPTPRDFAAGMANSAPTDDRVICIDIEGPRQGVPIVMVHHVGVNARFARSLGDVIPNPISAMFDRTAIMSPLGDVPEGAATLDIMETSRRYADEIARRHPDGPLLILGHCQGGVFAHEVAVLLAERGRDLAGLVVVFDWHAPHLPQRRRTVRDFVTAARRETVKGVVRNEVRWNLRRVNARLRPRSTAAQNHRFAMETNAAFHHHDYTPYEGRLLAVRGTDDPRWPVDGEEVGWRDEVGEVDIAYIEGPPFTGGGPEQLAALIRSELATATATVPATTTRR